jgi:hypothetical protein
LSGGGAGDLDMLGIEQGELADGLNQSGKHGRSGGLKARIKWR